MMTIPFLRWLFYFSLVGLIVSGLWKTALLFEQHGYLRGVAECQAAALKASAKAEKNHQIKLNEAIHAGTQRQKNLSALAARNAAAVISLRDELEAERNSLHALTRDAVDRYAGTASTVFAECTAEYSELAQKADAIASERQTLIEAWPQ